MRRDRGFAPLVMLILLGVAGVVMYFGLRNSNKLSTLPESTPVCRVNCPDSIPTPLPGSVEGWVKYEQPDGLFSFEYPENWFFLDQKHGIVEGGLYALDKEQIVALFSKQEHYSDDFHRWLLRYDDRKLSDYLDLVGEKMIGGNSKMVATNHYYYGKTNVVSYNFCNTKSMFVKGGTVRPYEECETTGGYIDMGKSGFIMTAYQPMTAESGKENELELYKKILSTVKFTR